MATKKSTNNDYEETTSSLYNLLYGIVEKKYTYEIQRESIIIDQAKNIQTLFSILSVALITLLPFLIDKLKKLESTIFIFYVIIFFMLFASFIIACIIQIRKKKNFWTDIGEVQNTIEQNYNTLKTDSEQKKWLVDNYKIILKDYDTENNFLLHLINSAQILIIIAIGILVIASVTLLILYYII